MYLSICRSGLNVGLDASCLVGLQSPLDVTMLFAYNKNTVAFLVQSTTFGYEALAFEIVPRQHVQVPDLSIRQSLFPASLANITTSTSLNPLRPKSSALSTSRLF